MEKVMREPAARFFFLLPAFVVITLLYLLPGTASADPAGFHYAPEGTAPFSAPVTSIPNLTPEEQKFLSTHPVIRVAAFTDYVPFEFIDDRGQYVGIGVDTLKMVAHRLGVRIEPRFGSWQECLQAVRDRRLDLLPNLVDLPSRREFLAFTRPYLWSPHVLAVPRESSLQSISDLAGKRVALLKGDYTGSLIQKHIPAAVLVEKESNLDALLSVISGEADTYLGNISQVSRIIDRNHIPGIRMVPFNHLEPLALSMGVRKDWAPLIPILEKALDSLSVSDRHTISRRYEPSLPEKKATLSLTPAQQTLLRDLPPLRMAMLESRPPFTFTGQNGVYSGMVMEYVSSVEHSLDISLTPVFGMTQTEMLDAIRNKEIDVLPAVVSHESRREYMLFTRPYLKIPLMIATRKDAAYVENLIQLEGKIVAVVQGDIVQSYLERDFPEIRLMPVANTEQALRAVENGRAFATIKHGAVLNFLTRSLNLDNIKLTGSTPYSYDLCFGVRKDMPELVMILDQALAAISEKDRAVFYERWVNHLPKPQVQLESILKVSGYIAAMAILIILMIIRWNRKLAAEILERKRAEQAVTDQLMFQTTLLDTVPSPIFIKDIEGRYVGCNKAYETLCGKSRQELIGNTIIELSTFPEEERRAFHARTPGCSGPAAPPPDSSPQPLPMEHPGTSCTEGPRSIFPTDSGEAW